MLYYNRISSWFPILFLIYVQNSVYHSSSLCDFLDLWLNYYKKTKGEIMFCVVGERINTSRKKVQEAVIERDAAYIQEDVKKNRRREPILSMLMQGHASVMKWRT